MSPAIFGLDIKMNFLTRRLCNPRLRSGVMATKRREGKKQAMSSLWLIDRGPKQRPGLGAMTSQDLSGPEGSWNAFSPQPTGQVSKATVMSLLLRTLGTARLRGPTI